ncbi:MAG: T9SS type A sorting domain-containing protein [Ignavibacteria bacterium]
MKKLFVILVMLVAMNVNAQWVQMSNGMGSGGTIYSISEIGSNIFAGTENVGVFISTNYGVNWTQTPLNNQSVRSIVTTGSNIFAGTSGGGVYLSTNNGTNWVQTTFNSQYVRSLAISGNSLFAGIGNTPTGTGGIYLSTNSGVNWTLKGLNDNDAGCILINGIYIFAAASNYNLGTGGLFLSTNNGNSWVQTSLNNKAVSSLAISGSNLFAGTDSGVYISSNNGGAWTKTTLNYQVRCLSVNGNTLIAGTLGGVYLSTNSGSNWFLKNQGFGVNPSISSLLISNNYVFAGTYGAFVWRRSLSEIIGIQNISTETPSKYSLSQNYPNPFNPTTNIKFSIVNTGEVKLVVYDIQGREVQTLVNESLKPGTYEAAFDGSALNSGVYFYKLITNTFSETKKMLLIK